MENQGQSRPGAASSGVQAIIGLLSIALGVIISVFDGTIAGVVLIILGVFGLALAIVRRHQVRRVAEPKQSTLPDEPPVGSLYIAISGVMLFLGAGYMFYQGSRYVSQDSPMAIVGFAGGLLAAILGTYVFMGLLLLRRKAPGKLGRLTAKLYPKLANGRPANSEPEDGS